MTLKPIMPPGTGRPLVPYTPGILADGVLYISGILPLDASANVVYPGDAAAQTHHVMQRIHAIVASAGGAMSQVTNCQLFITDWANYDAINRAYADYFLAVKPARVCVLCGLVKPEALVQISAIAHVRPK